MDTFSNLSILIPNHNEKRIQETQFWCEVFYPKAEIIIENDPEGKGKGYTLRRALLRSTRGLIVLIDGDMDIFPLKICKLLPYLETHDIVIGSKEIPSLFPRNLITIFSRKFIKTLFRLPISDTQTGIKLFKRESLSSWQSDGYLFDIEILYKAHKQGFKIKEVPIKNVVISKQKSLSTLWRTLCQAISLSYRLSFRL